MSYIENNTNKMLFIFVPPMTKKLLFAFMILLPGLRATGQDTAAHRMAVNIGVHRGFLVAHRPLIIPLQQKHISGIEAQLVLKPDGSKQWHHIYGFPEMGISLSVWDLGNKDQLGMGIALVPYLDFPLVRGTKTFFDLKFGWGIGYIEKTFDADENYKNVAIGSHLNCALILQPHIKTKISKRLTLSGGISLTHFSNGSVATPNLGLNLASITAGMAYKFGPANEIKNLSLPPFYKSSRYSFFVAGSMKQIYPADGKDYFACTLSANRSWQKTRKSSFGFGADMFYDNSIHKKLEERGMKLNNSAETIRLGIHAGYEITIADISVLINMGGYLYSKLKNDGSIYHRFGMRYRLNERVFALMQLKAHWGKADYIEWGIGYRVDKFKSK